MRPEIAARISFGVGVVVLALKLVAWKLTGSVALYSDALESIVNVVAALVATIALRVAAMPADENHPWGHAKAEHFSAGAEGALVAVAAIAILHEVAGKVLHPSPIAAFGEGAAISAAASGVNLALGLWLRRAGRTHRSPALSADGTHVLSDVYTSGGVLAGIAVAKATGLWVLDPLIACAVALHVLWAGFSIVRASVAALMDEGVPTDERERIVAAIRSAMSPAKSLHDLRARRSGPRVFVEVHLVVAGAMPVRESHDICDAVEAAVRVVAPDLQMTIHVDPDDHEEDRV